MPRRLTKADFIAIASPSAPALAALLLHDLPPAARLSATAGVAALACVGVWYLGIRRRLSAHAQSQAEAGSLLTEAAQLTETELVPDHTFRQSREALSPRLRLLRLELARRRAAFDSADSVMLATDASGQVVLANRAAREFFGGRTGDLSGRPAEDLFTHARIQAMIAGALRGERHEGQIRLPGTGGRQRVYQVHAVPMPAGGTAAGGGSLVMMRDVTELAMALQLKTDFVANASHELRTPLSSIKAALETLTDGAWNDPTMRERLSRMAISNVERLEDLVRDLLDLSRLESADTGEPAPTLEDDVDLNALAGSLAESIAPLAKERAVTISVEVDPSLTRLRTDRKLLEAILRNLIDNAVKFAYERTTVRVRCEPLPEGPSSRAGRRGVRLRVIDRGIGIPIGHQQRIFERFYQVDAARSGDGRQRGTGLGLAIVKYAVKALGGTIAVESVWKSGTTMTVDLPGCAQPPDAAHA
ncbi:MAG: PAS domain-containing protein [Phycisphaeraceae bacterium]|nr:PAS domain-containing protein [Phycisphaeraceae bacterium]